MTIKRVITIPNILSMIRLIAAYVMLGLAIAGLPNAFVVVLIGAFILDAIDGPIARLTNQVSELGPKIDTWADYSVYLMFLVGAILLWPDIIIRERVYMLLVAASLVLPALTALIKFRRPTSYHTWLVKLAAVVMAPSAIILFLGGPAWPFHVGTILAVLAAMEEILITLILDQPRSDVASLYHVISPDRD